MGQGSLRLALLLKSTAMQSSDLSEEMVEHDELLTLLFDTSEVSRLGL